jgi:hypothetical protein
VETSVGEPLISMRPFAIRKWSDWLVSNEFPCLPSSLPSYTKAATISYRAPSRRLLTDSTQKTLGLQKPYVPNIVGRQNVQECLHMVKWGVNGWPVSRHEHLDATLCSLPVLRPVFPGDA